MLQPGKPVAAHCGVIYQLTTRVGLPCLVCTLLNGKLLHYFNARMDGADKYGKPRWVCNAYKQGQWREIAPYGGQLTENVVSALSRELLVHAMFALEAAGYPIVLTVHDEIVVEHPASPKKPCSGSCRRARHGPKSSTSRSRPRRGYGKLYRK